MFVVSCFNSKVSCFLIFFGSCLLRQTMKAVKRDQKQLQRLPALWLWWGVSKHTTAFIFFLSTERRGRYMFQLCQSCHPDPPGKNLFVYKRDANVENWAPTSITILILHPPARKALSIHPVWTSNMLYPPVFAVLICIHKEGDVLQIQMCSLHPAMPGTTVDTMAMPAMLMTLGSSMPVMRFDWWINLIDQVVCFKRIQLL